MNYFLERIASHMLDEYSDRLDRQCLVFPNRRGGLYYQKYLASRAGKPVWSPAIKTINELFLSFSHLKIAENETLIFELYKIFKSVNPGAESFDDFYFWGETIINDFDDVDKYTVDATRLFTNLSDLKRIDKMFGELTDEQLKIVRQFWVNFNSGSITREKNDFLEIWTLLPDMYKKFREALSGKGIAYEGMIFRDLAEKCREGKLPELKWDAYHFIGFNALNKCEKDLLKTLRKAGKAKFYWDYDNSYTDDGTDHSAGYFIRSNLREFGNDMPDDWNYSTCLSSPSGNLRRRIIDTSSDVAQVKLIPELLNDINEIHGDEACQTAIVLADESMLVPLLSSIPEKVEDINITMGYPLKFSPVYSLVKNLLSLQTNCRREDNADLFSYKDIFSILSHNYFSDEKRYHSRSVISDLIAENRTYISSGRFSGIAPFDNIFRRVDDPRLLSSYLKTVLETIYITNNDESGYVLSADDKMRNEFIYRVLLIFNRIERIISESDIPLTVISWTRLLDKIMRGITIPFTGEPLKGIQVMGILETRTLDFRNLIILSVNEGVLPKSSAGMSYIPYNLREAFGLPTLRHQDSIYAYYFYRLLHKTENVVFVYNSNSEGLKTGEMSRFLLQLNYLDPQPPLSSGISFEIAALNKITESIKRNEKHDSRIRNIFLGNRRKPVSPRAVNTWLNCRMKFYYMYVCGLEEPEKIVTEIDPVIFGSLLHKTMERIYSPFTGKIIGKEDIGKLMKDRKAIQETVMRVIIDKYYGGAAGVISGNEQIVSGILETYVKLILGTDNRAAPFRLAELEKQVSTRMKLTINSEKAEIIAGGIIDRLDVSGGVKRILDYKTGTVSMEIKSVESLFDETDDKRNDAWFQILMYCEILYDETGNMKIRPAIYPVRDLSDPDFTDNLKIRPDKETELILEDYSTIRDTYRRELVRTLESMFSMESDFIMTEHSRKCDYCQFRQLCRR